MKSERRIELAVRMGLLVFCVALVAGCVSGQQASLDNWDLDKSSDCKAVGLEFLVDGSTLASIIGSNFAPQLDPVSNEGSLRIEMLQCAAGPIAGAQQVPFASSRVLIDLDESQLPIRMSGMDRWDSYALHIAAGDSPISRFMRLNHVATVSGATSLRVENDEDAHALVGKILFEAGGLSLRVPRTCSTRPFSRRRAIVGTGHGYFSLFFGQESGASCQLEKASLDIEGQTPFSDLDLDLSSVSAEYQESISWRLAVWREANLSLK